MESPAPSVSIASSFGEILAHNMWNPLLELLFHEQTSGVFDQNVEEIELAKIALSCHFSIDLLCYKEGVHDDYEDHFIWYFDLRIHVCHVVAPLSQLQVRNF